MHTMIFAFIHTYAFIVGSYKIVIICCCPETCLLLQTTFVGLIPRQFIQNITSLCRFHMAIDVGGLQTAIQSLDEGYFHV